MNASLRLALWFVAALVMTALAARPGCAGDPAASEKEPISWDSPKLREIEQEWDSLQETYRKTPEKIPGDGPKSKYGEIERLKWRLLDKRLSDRELQRLAETAELKPDGRFTDEVVEFMVSVFTETADRDNLVTLLSKRCPLHVGGMEICFYLAVRGNQLKDPILVLGESYSKCQAPATRHDLATAVRHGFAGLGFRDMDDADYVKSAMQWYEKEKDHLTVNLKYPYDGNFDPPDRLEDPKLYDGPPGSRRERLFAEKSASEESAALHPEPGQSESEPVPVGAETPSATSGESAEIDLAKLAGTWEVTEWIIYGGAISKTRMDRVRVVFHDEMMQWINLDRAEVVHESRVRLEGRQHPAAIDLIAIPTLGKEQTTPLVYELLQQTTPGICELKGETLRICLPRNGARHRPTSIKSEKGSHEALVVFQRVDKATLDLAAVAADPNRLPREYYGTFTWKKIANSKRSIFRLTM